MMHTQIDAEHLLLALIEQKGCIVPQILSRMMVDSGTLRISLSDNLQKVSRTRSPFRSGEQRIITQEASNVFESAVEYARQLRDPVIGSEHLLLGVMAGTETHAGQMLIKAGFTPENVLTAIQDLRATRRAARPNTGAFSHFTESAQEAAQLSIEAAGRYDHRAVDVEHIMMGLLEQPHGMIVQLLEIVMVDSWEFRELLGWELKRKRQSTATTLNEGQVIITERARKVIERSQQEANQLSDEKISTEHILLAILDKGNSMPARYLRERSLTRDVIVEVRDVIRANTIDGTSPGP
jgi:ATP-dependent Clp protease ATP-binding subunit ClpA